MDDDPQEVETFHRLYSGERFSVTGVCANTPEDALTELASDLKGAVPGLFVLDMYFPLSTDAPAGFEQTGATEMARHKLEMQSVGDSLERLKAALESGPQDGKTLLRKAHSVVHEARSLLDSWCSQLQQSALGGIRLLKMLDQRPEYKKVPKVFYSRKATLSDAKLALDNGAVDVLSKPDESGELLERIEIGDRFVQYSNAEPPHFMASWFKRFGVELASERYNHQRAKLVACAPELSLNHKVMEECTSYFG